jgi:galactokinase
MQIGTKTKRVKTKLARMLVLALSLTALTACSDNQSASQSANQGPALPVSLNDVMVALVNKATDSDWTAVWNNPQTDRDWRELEHLAFQVQTGGGLMQAAGTGPMDAEWVADAEWQRLAAQLEQDGIRAVNAVRSRNIELMQRAGGQLIETCESCHQQFATDLPRLDQMTQRPAVSL